MSFHSDDHACCVWGFGVEDAALPDPPVYNGMELDFEGESGRISWIRQNASLSEWALHRTLCDHLAHQGPGLEATVSREEASKLLTGFRDLGFPRQPWYQCALYGGPNAIAVTWPTLAAEAWARVVAAGPHPTLVSNADWDQLWEPALSGPVWITLYFRDPATLESTLATPGSQWKVLRAWA